MTTAVLITYYMPHVMAAIVLVALVFTPVPSKPRFFVREVLALAVACFIAHINREFELWPAYRYFASGHMSFCLGASLSLGLLRPFTLLITLPLLIPYGSALVLLGFHRAIDVMGAIPIVLLVYALVRRWWRIPFTPIPSPS